ncbi:hypothetical protein F4825DRAFT_446541 [Nemania diffusa]|nr:hypothetical protein F4825DRAFT_446541 [Nemania diffusa]
MAHLASIATKLLNSGEYSDFTIVCEGEEFRVHKAIVCPQSPVIAAALKSEFKEAGTNTMEVNFDAGTLECMLDFIYTGRYSDTPFQPTQLAQPTSTSAGNQPAESTANNEGENTPATLPTISDILIHHACVNIIANYYGVSDLAKTSANRIQTVLQSTWSADAFCELIETIGSAGDESLRQVFMTTIHLHIDELLEKYFLFKEKIADNLGAEVREAAIRTFKSAQARESRLQSEIEAKNREIQNLKEDLLELAKIVLEKSHCRNRECKTHYGYLAVRFSQDLERCWFVRCTACGTRHMYDKKTRSIILAPLIPRKRLLSE